jgi:hypothetical protein
VENRTAHWLVLLQSGYRVFYLFNWVDRYFTQGYWDPISVYTGSIQVATTLIALGAFFSVQGNPELSTPSSLTLTIRLHCISILRYIQLGTIVIVGYVFCYLVWMRNHHPCKWNTYYCTDIGKANADVPWQYICMITVVHNPLQPTLTYLAFSCVLGKLLLNDPPNSTTNDVKLLEHAMFHGSRRSRNKHRLLPRYRHPWNDRFVLLQCCPN